MTALFLNSSKTVVLTTEAQPPTALVTPAGLELKVVDRETPHKWLGCVLAAKGARNLDTEYHLQAANKAFQYSKFSTRFFLIDTRPI